MHKKIASIGQAMMAATATANNPSLGPLVKMEDNSKDAEPDYEQMFSDRYSDKDLEYQEFYRQPPDPPPIVTDWASRSRERQRQRFPGRGRQAGQWRGQQRNWTSHSGQGSSDFNTGRPSYGRPFYNNSY
uniref:RNA guanine-N7 methyltransferase-activating subunit-like protein n=1 Tax=Myxine glutinosa TaxID=7769 RepID=UPI00358F6E0E